MVFRAPRWLSTGLLPVGKKSRHLWTRGHLFYYAETSCMPEYNFFVLLLPAFIIIIVEILFINKKNVLSQGNRAMPHLFFFNLKFADNIRYKFKSSQASKARLQSSKHAVAKQNAAKWPFKVSKGHVFWSQWTVHSSASIVPSSVIATSGSNFSHSFPFLSFLVCSVSSLFFFLVHQGSGENCEPPGCQAEPGHQTHFGLF